MKIISIEDNQIYSLLLKQTFENKLNHSVTCYSSCEVFLASHNTECDVILLDNQFKGLKGIEIIDLLTGLFPKTKIIVLSASNDPELKRQYLEKGVFDFLNKSDYSVEKLVFYFQFNFN